MSLKLAFLLLNRIVMMFYLGEKVTDIKSTCLVDYGNYFHDKKSIDKAITYYNRALHLNPDNFYANVALAAALLEKKEFPKALDYLKRAAAIKKPDILTTILLFIGYESIDDGVSARRVLEEIFKYFKNNEAAAYDRISHSYYELGVYQRGEHYIKEALKIHPSLAGPHYNLALIYLAQADLELARNEFQKVLELASKKDKFEIRLRKLAYDALRDIDKRSRRGKELVEKNWGQPLTGDKMDE